MPLPRPLRFGVSRSHGGSSPAEAARELCRVLGARLGVGVEVHLAAGYDALADGLIAGKLHLGWMPPLAHARATREGAVLAAVCERRGALTYRSALLVRADSMHTSVGSLRGVRAAWTDPSSAAGYVWPRLHLSAHGVDPRRDLGSEKFYGSASAALSAVATGEADLAGLYVRDAAGDDHSLALQDADRILLGARERLRVVDVTDRIPPDGVVLSDRLDLAAQAALRDALLTLHEQPDGAQALATLMQADRLRGVTAEVQKIIARLAHVHLS